MKTEYNYIILQNYLFVLVFRFAVRISCVFLLPLPSSLPCSADHRREKKGCEQTRGNPTIYHPFQRARRRDEPRSAFGWRFTLA